MLRVGRAPFKLSAYTNQDSDGNPMVKAHAYKAVGAGVVYASNSLVAGQWVYGYVGLTNDPAGAGINIQSGKCAEPNQSISINFGVAKNEYFEIVSDAAAPTIYWKSYGTLKKPVDFN